MKLLPSSATSAEARINDLLARLALPWARGNQGLIEMLTKEAHRLCDEMDALEDQMSARRDWLDAHRRDDPPHPKYAARHASFFGKDVKRHADAGALLESALAEVERCPS